MNGEGPGKNLFHISSGLFAEARHGAGVFQAEMALLLPHPFQVGLAAISGFRAIDIVKPQVKIPAVSLHLKAVAIVPFVLDQPDIFEGDQLGGGERRGGLADKQQGREQTADALAALAHNGAAWTRRRASRIMPLGVLLAMGGS